MRFKQFKPRQLTKAELKQLDELRMNPTTLQQFGASDEARGIMAGFEAELVFTGLGGESDYDQDPEPDYDADERCRSISQVIEFFSNDEYGYAAYGRDLNNLQDGLDEKYMEWSDEKMYEAFRDEQEDLIRKIWLDENPMEERVHAVLVDGMDLDDREADRIQAVGDAAPKFNTSTEAAAYMKQNPDYALYIEAVEDAEEILKEDVENSINKQDGYYDSALDDFRDGFYVDDDSGFFSDVGLRWMSDVASEFSLMWPIITYTGQSNEGGFDESNAERLADDLHEKLGVKTKVSSGYHSAKRDAVTWIFEPDSSLDANDSENMPVEIVSPPMPLEECLTKMQQFFEWAESNGAYANSSTGFHMGVSLPHRGGDVDYVKLALFLGDEYVLKDFGRSGNHFTEAAIKKIRNRVKGNREAVGGAMELMRNNLLELAQKALEINNNGFGKYTSINPQGGSQSNDPTKNRGARYIEFRSAGGTNYFEDIDKLKNTLLRYAQAMTIAANPAAERREYYKKLYKLISPPEGDPAIDLFARFAAGEISSADLKKSWADKQLDAEPKGNWKLWNANNGVAVPGQEYNGYTKSDAWERAKKKIQPGSSMEDFQRAYTLRSMQSQTGDWEVYDVKTGKTLETLHGFETRGAAADSVYDKYAGQGIAFNLRPADPDAPEPKLSQREKLAKRIKAPKPNWNVVYRPTGRVIDQILNVSREEAVKLLPKVAKQHDFNSVDDLELQNKKDTPQDTANPAIVKRKWEFYRTETGNIIDTVDDIDQMQAEAVRRDIVRRYGHEDSSVGKRSVPTDASQDRWRDQLANHVHQAQQTTDTPPQGFSTQRPGTGDYYEVRGGNDRVYGYLPGSVGNSMAAADTALAARRYVNNLTGDDRAYVQYRAGDPVQATAPNGVPVWEVYERESGHVVHTFADHDQTSSWATAQAWLRGVSAEDPSLFSVRPKMES